MFCNELQCHNSFWSGITVTFLKACVLNLFSQSECASTCWNPKYDQVAGLYSELHSLQVSSLEGGLCTDWIMHSVGLPSKLFIYLHSLPACDMPGRGFSRNSCLKYSVLFVRRLGHPRPVLSPSASRVGFQGVPYRRNYVPKSVFLALSYLPFFFFPLFNINPSVKPLSPVISGKGSVLAWPALPTCLWRVS